MVTEESKKKGYETTDTPTPPVVIGLIVLVALMLLGFVGGKIFQEIFEATEVKTRPEVEPLAVREAVDGPLLQAHPEVELGAYLATERQKLSTYGWVDRSAGIVRIPIERAMELVVRDGLPKWEPVTAKLPERVEEKAAATGSESGDGEGGSPDDAAFTGTETLPE